MIYQFNLPCHCGPDDFSGAKLHGNDSSDAVAQRIIVVPPKFTVMVAQTVCKRASGTELWRRLQLSVTSDQNIRNDA